MIFVVAACLEEMFVHR